uniref:Uncharacterized protein n=1 Tax=Glossina austeni TaxID=7395 RepID=A0A1A9V5A4_GLOAU
MLHCSQKVSGDVSWNVSGSDSSSLEEGGVSNIGIDKSKYSSLGVILDSWSILSRFSTISENRPESSVVASSIWMDHFLYETLPIVLSISVLLRVHFMIGVGLPVAGHTNCTELPEGLWMFSSSFLGAPLKDHVMLGKVLPSGKQVNSASPPLCFSTYLLNWIGILNCVLAKLRYFAKDAVLVTIEHLKQLTTGTATLAIATTSLPPPHFNDSVWFKSRSLLPPPPRLDSEQIKSKTLVDNSNHQSDKFYDRYYADMHYITETRQKKTKKTVIDLFDKCMRCRHISSCYVFELFQVYTSLNTSSNSFAQHLNCLRNTHLSHGIAIYVRHRKLSRKLKVVHVVLLELLNSFYNIKLDRPPVVRSKGSIIALVRAKYSKSTVSSSARVLERTLNIANRAASFGKEHSTKRSIRPERNKAGSSNSGLEVAAITVTPCKSSTPSSSVIWKRCLPRGEYNRVLRVCTSLIVAITAMGWLLMFHKANVNFNGRWLANTYQPLKPPVSIYSPKQVVFDYY